MQYLSFPVQTNIRRKHNTFRISTTEKRWKSLSKHKNRKRMPSGQLRHHFAGVLGRLALPVETHPCRTNSVSSSGNPVVGLAAALEGSTDSGSKFRAPGKRTIEQDRACRSCTGTIPITEQGYHNLISLQSLGFWPRHKLVIFRNKLRVLQNLIRSVIDSNNINVKSIVFEISVQVTVELERN